MNDVYEKLGDLRLVPIVKIDKAADAPRLAEALLAGGLPCVEFTFRTDAAAEAIRTVASRGDMLVGAGTVLNVENAKIAADNGASFIVTPGLNPRVVEYCLKNNITIAPGVCTPTDIETAMGFGLDVLKFFPAEAMGGVKTLKAIGGPFSMVRFIPTGGITASSVAQYLALKQVLCCGGSWMVKWDLIADRQFDKITQLTKDALSAIRG